MAAKQDQKLLAVRIPVELHKRLKLEGVRRSISMAALVEAALRHYLGGRHGGAS